MVFAYGRFFIMGIQLISQLRQRGELLRFPQGTRLRAIENGQLRS